MNKKISASLEDYLKQMYLIALEEKEIRVTDVAVMLGISKASVNKAVNQLKAQGLVMHEHYGSMELTEEGAAMAEEILENYKVSLKFLTAVLGAEPEEAEAQAHLMEHIISKSTRKKLKKFIKKQKKA